MLGAKRSKISGAGDEKSALMVEWLSNNNCGWADGVVLQDTDVVHGRGVVSNAPLCAGLKLFSIPNELLVKLSNSDIVDILGEDVDPSVFTGWSSLIITLMFEDAKPDSKWRPYLDVLPSADEITSPAFWLVEERAELAGTGILERLGLEALQEEFSNVALEVLEIPELSITKKTFREYLRWASIIMAYSFCGGENASKDDTDDDNDEDDDDDLLSEPSLSEIFLVPMADMFNHDNSKLSVRLFWENDRVDMKVHMDVEEGVELFNTYGDLGNDELLRKYGFVLGDNADDTVDFSLEFMIESLESSCLLSKQQKNCLNRMDDIWDSNLMAESDIQFGCSEMENPSYHSCRLLVSLHLAVFASKDEFREVLADENRLDFLANASLGEYLEEENGRDDNLLRLSCSLIEARLAQYPQDLSKDKQRLENLEKQDNHINRSHEFLKMALIVRIRQQEILSGLLKYLREHQNTKK